jgi:hypothetical protein
MTAPNGVVDLAERRSENEEARLGELGARIAALEAVMFHPCDPLGDHMARCVDPSCQVCNRPKHLSLVEPGALA